MNHYRVYGGCLGSTVEFPELQRVATPPSRCAWTFRTVPSLEAMQNPQELGAENIYGDVFARVYHHANGHRITVDDTGAFDLSANHTDIRCQEREGAWPDFVRAHVLGRVLATSQFFEGLLPLHGSAVAFDGGVAAFLAPKGYGKSSLALALTLAGGRLVTDDTLPVEVSATPRARPGVHSMRMHSDSLAALDSGYGGVATREGKTLVTDLPLERRADEALPLTALYILDPIDATEPAAVARTVLAETPAALLVVAHVKIARMLGAGAAATLLDRAASIVRAVPVYRLATPRSLSMLTSAAAQIRQWHLRADGARNV